MATLNLTEKEMQEIFYNVLCDGLDYCSYFGSVSSCNKEDYATARKNFMMTNLSVCIEDVLLQILRDGGKLQYIDNEDESMNCQISMQDVYDRISLVPIDTLNDMINGEYDAETCDIILQTILFKEVIFG